MLRRLQTKDVGPAREMDLALGSRLNVLTGDNGVGKSFVLDLVWYVLFILVDEPEVHLHPRGQRRILPALMVRDRARAGASVP